MSEWEMEEIDNFNEQKSEFTLHHNVRFSDYIYAAGGFRPYMYLKSCHKMDTKTFKWTLMPQLNNARSLPGLFVTADKKYLYCFKGTVLS